MEKLQNMCRICLSVNANINLIDEKLIPLFGKLMKKFVICTAVKISADDPLPKYICQMCVNKLNAAFRLREMAQDADKELRKRLGNIKVDIEVNMKYEVKSEDKIQPEDEDNQLDHAVFESKDIENVKIGEDSENVWEAVDTTNADVLPLEFKSTGIDFDTLEIIKVESAGDTEEYLLPKSKTQSNRNKKNETKFIKKRSRCKTRKALGYETNIAILNPTDFIDKLKSYELAKKRDEEESEDDDVIEINTAHKTGNKTLRYCTLCNISFTQTLLFRRHMRVEHKLEGFSRMKDYMCDVCGSTFHDRYGLRMHKRSHSGDRPFTCNICGQGFTQHSNMERHITALHKKVKPFQCEICSKDFAYSSSLRDHKLRHAGLLSHQCSVCNRKFARNFALVRHQLIHTQARPYVCKHCGRSYTQSNDLKTHVKKIHPDQPVEKFSDYCIKYVGD